MVGEIQKRWKGEALGGRGQGEGVEKCGSRFQHVLMTAEIIIKLLARNSTAYKNDCILSGRKGLTT